ncbi:MAG: fuculose phosphate aldolase [Deltaproteobacteria bacterium]|nr:MAG: fuculose phosphate aldolase [Deltaproteobacteria bacterium]
MYEQFRDIGRDLYLGGLVSSHAGNMSVRMGDRILITRRGSMVGRLKPDDLIETGLDADDAMVTLASSELIVHRAIYKATSALAIVHTHPPHATALSLSQDAIVPVDSEGSYLLHKVPVVEAAKTIGSSEVAEVIPPALRDHKVAMLRGHGSFAVGELLEEAFMVTSSLEFSSRILYLVRTLGGDHKEYRKSAERYETW